MKEILDLNLIIIIPAAFIGVLGGLLGALFIFLHLKVAKYRRMVISSIQNKRFQDFIKLSEAVILAVIQALVFNHSFAALCIISGTVMLVYRQCVQRLSCALCHLKAATQWLFLSLSQVNMKESMSSFVLINAKFL